jgi:uncharacterized protein
MSGDGIIQTWSGLLVDVRSFAFEEADVRVIDVAASLAKQCRFNGHTTAFYSVAQHSVLASCYVGQFLSTESDDELRLLTAQAALFHDAAEAYLGDIASPLRDLFSGYDAAEKNIDDRVRSRLGFRVSDEIQRAVKAIDMDLLLTEKRDLLKPAEWPNPPTGQPLSFKIRPWNWEKAQAVFLKRFDFLFGTAVWQGVGDGNTWYGVADECVS